MFVSLLLRNYGKTKVTQLKQKRWDLWNQRKTKTRKLSSFYGVEMRGACWHKNTRNRLWICIVIKICILLFSGTVFCSTSYALNIVSYYGNTLHLIFWMYIYSIYIYIFFWKTRSTTPRTAIPRPIAGVPFKDLRP